MSPGAQALARQERRNLRNAFLTAALIAALCVLGLVGIVREFLRVT